MRYILFLSLMGLHLLIPAQDLTTKQRKEINKLLASQADPNSPGIAVGIVSEGTILYQAYEGLANMEFQIPFDSQTKTNIASNAKQFTAFCILVLLDEGKLSLQDDFRKYVSEILSGHEEKITILHLLTHSSGIRDYYDLLGIKGQTWWAIESFDNEDALEVLKDQNELNFSPGTQYLYSNSNYTLLAEIVKSITGQDFADYAREVFSELGMNNTLFQTNYMAVMANKARPYANWGDWMEYPAITHPYGDGGLFTTLPDQLRWEQILQNHTLTNYSEELLAVSQQPVAGAAIQSYGYGLEHSTYKGIPIFYHDGGTGAYKASFIRFPEQQLAIVAMSNSGQSEPNGLVRGIAEIILDPALFSIPETPQAPSELSPAIEMNDALGFYQHEDGSLVGFVINEGVISWKTGQNRPFQLEVVEGNLFQLKEQPALRVSFHLEESQPYMMVYYPGSTPRKHLKSIDIGQPEPYFTAAEGSYYSEELGIEAEVRYIDGERYTVSVGEDDMEANMLFTDKLEMEGYSLTFVRDDSGKVTDILLGGERVKRIRFKRDK